MSDDQKLVQGSGKAGAGRNRAPSGRYVETGRRLLQGAPSLAQAGRAAGYSEATLHNAEANGLSVEGTTKAALERFPELDPSARVRALSRLSSTAIGKAQTKLEAQGDNLSTLELSQIGVAASRAHAEVHEKFGDTAPGNDWRAANAKNNVRLVRHVARALEIARQGEPTVQRYVRRLTGLLAASAAEPAIAGDPKAQALARHVARQLDHLAEEQP